MKRELGFSNWKLWKQLVNIMCQRGNTSVHALVRKYYCFISSEVFSQPTKRRTLSSLVHQLHWPKIQRKQTRAPVNARSSRSSQASKPPSVLQQTAQRCVEEEQQSLKIRFVMTKKGQSIKEKYSIDSLCAGISWIHSL